MRPDVVTAAPYAVRDGNTQGEEHDGHGVLDSLRPLARGRVNAQQKQVARLRVREDLATAQIRVGIHKAA